MRRRVGGEKMERKGREVSEKEEMRMIAKERSRKDA